VPLVALPVILGTADMTRRWGMPLYWPPFVESAEEFLQPFHVINAYGLFAAMTTTRNEIVVEGSDDGQVWQAYEFRWKPGDPMRAPRFVAPHQPRLDWQMWFAALSSYRNQPWFQNFLVRLLQGSPDVLALLERNPFPDRPPRYIRSRLYDYRFSDLPTRRSTGAWWERRDEGLYSPVQSLRQAP
jgi:lipase maturation factor 1